MIGYRSVILLSVYCICYSFGSFPNKIPPIVLILLLIGAIFLDSAEFQERFPDEKKEQKDKKKDS